MRFTPPKMISPSKTTMMAALTSSGTPSEV